MNPIAQVIDSLLPAITAVIGLIGGLLVMHLGEKRRRQNSLLDHRRDATAALVHELFALVTLQPAGDRRAYNECVVRITEASVRLELEYTGDDALRFYSWFDTRVSSALRLAAVPPKTDTELTALANDVQDITRRLALLYRGAISSRQLGMSPGVLPQ